MVHFHFLTETTKSIFLEDVDKYFNYGLSFCVCEKICVMLLHGVLQLGLLDFGRTKLEHIVC